ncbi:MAG: TRAM domain-containing protein [Acidimicrobiales bacterium]
MRLPTPPAPPDPVASERVEIDVTAVVAGGDGLGRHADGRVVLVRGALPGERVTAVVTKAEKRLLRADVDEVVVAAPARVAPPCPRVADGCGGCGWQHVAPDAQPALKAAIAADALRRIGRLEPPAIDLGPRLDPTGYRTTVRAAVDDEGRAAFRRHHTHDLVVVGDTEAGCLVAHPLVDEVLRAAAFPGAGEVVVRAGAAPGERLVVVDPSGAARAVGVPAGLRVVGGDHLRGSSPTRAWYHEEVAGRRFRISARSFFQARPDGAAALVDAVRDAAAGASDGAALGGRSRLVDLYGGVGLFAAARGAEVGGGVTLVESAASAVAGGRGWRPPGRGGGPRGRPRPGQPQGDRRQGHRRRLPAVAPVAGGAGGRRPRPGRPRGRGGRADGGHRGADRRRRLVRPRRPRPRRGVAGHRRVRPRLAPPGRPLPRHPPRRGGVGLAAEVTHVLRRFARYRR